MYGHMPKKERGYINMSEKKGFFKSFKEFAMKGNVVDMAVGVIIGGAFGKIVTSLVNDIIMPLIGILIGGYNFSELSWKIGEATVKYGSFLQSVVDFLIIALSIFAVLKLMMKLISLRKHEEEEKADEEEEKKSDELLLLEEIRDLLKDSKK